MTVAANKQLSAVCALWQDTVKECTFQPVTTWRSLSRAAPSGAGTADAALDLTTASIEAAMTRWVQSKQTSILERKECLAKQLSW